MTPDPVNSGEDKPPRPLDEALTRVGDRWSLLVVAAMLDGPRRFNDLLKAVAGIAPNTLSQRLKHLEHQGVVVATPYSRKPPRLVYDLTAGGRELAGALRLLAQWGAATSDAVDGVQHAACGARLEARWYCPTCEQAVELDDDDLRYL